METDGSAEKMANSSFGSHLSIAQVCIGQATHLSSAHIRLGSILQTLSTVRTGQNAINTLFDRAEGEIFRQRFYYTIATLHDIYF
jgi:hypothetical protein